MADEVDDRVVNMKFDNAAFEQKARETLATLTKLHDGLKLTEGLKGLSNVNVGDATEKLGHMASAVESISSKFNALGAVAFTVISNITNKVTDAALNFGKQFTVAPIMDGFREMETKIGSIQTILANTAAHGTGLHEVEQNLSALNDYSDKTIYNFGQMTKNIGLFTNAGIKVGDATQMIKGFSNEAAASGTNAEGAAGAAYQLSQALSAGKVTLMDWRSLQNVGMGNANMKKGILEIAQAMGTLEKNGVTSAEVQENFNGTLEKGWLTADVMSKYLKIMSGDMDAAAMKSIGLSAAQIAAFEKQQNTAEEAATKVRTFTQLVGTIKESVGSGWAETFEILTGGFEGSTEIFTGINNAVGTMVSRFSEARNEVLKAWAAFGGREALLEALKNVFGSLGAIINDLRFAFHGLFPSEGAAPLLKITAAFADFVATIRSFVHDNAANFVYIFAAILSTLKIGIAIIKGVTSLFIDFFKALYPDRAGSGALGFLGNLAEALYRLNVFLLDNGIPAFFKGLSFILVGVAKIIGGVLGKITDFFIGLQYYKAVEPIIRFFKDLGGRLKSVFSLIGRGLEPVAALGQAFGSFPAGEKLVALFNTVRDGLNTVGAAATQAFDILFRGDYHGGPLGVEDDSLISKLFTIRETFQNVMGVAKQFFDIIFRGDFTGGPLQEDSKIVAFLFTLRDAFAEVADKIRSIDFKGLLGDIGDILVEIKDKLADFFSFGDTGEMDKVSKSLEKVNTQFELISHTIGAADLGGEQGGFEKKSSGLMALFQTIGDYIGAFIDTVTGYVGKIVEIGTQLRNAISKFFTGSEIVSDRSTFQVLVDIINTILLTGILISVRSFISQFGGLVKDARGIFKNLSDTLSSFGQESKPTQLLKIGIALALLAASLYTISQIPREDLYASLAALGAGLTVMLGGLVGMDKLLKGNNLAKAATAMVVLSTALLVMAQAIKVLGQLEPEELVKGLIAASVGMAVLAAATRLVQSNGPGMIAASIAIVALSGALLIMAGAVKLFALFDPKELAIGLAAASTALLALGFAAGKMGPGMALAGPGILIMSAALLVVAEAVRQFGAMDMGVLAKGLGAIFVALGAIAATVGSMPPSFLLVAAGMPIIAVAILMIAEAVRRLGEIKGGDLAKGLIAMVIALTAVAAAANAMTSALPGAVAMIIVAKAMEIMTEAIIKMGSQDFKTLATGIGAMVVSFLLLAAAGAFLSPFLAALGAAMLVLGAGFLLFGIGVAATVAAFVYLVNAANDNSREFIGVLKYLAEEMPKVIAVFVESLAESAKDVAKSFDKMMDAVEDMIIRVLDAVIAVIPKLIETADAIVDAILLFISNRLVDFIDMGFQIMLALMQGLLNNIGEITVTAIKILAEFARTVDREMPSIIDSGVRIIKAFLYGLGARMNELVQAGVDVVLQFLWGLGSQALALANGAAQALVQFLEGLAVAIRVNAPAIRKAGVDVADAILSGITAGLSDKVSISKVLDKAREMATQVVDAVKGIFDSNSPSKVFMGIAKDNLLGMAIGFDRNGNIAEHSAVRNAEAIVAAFAETLSRMPRDLDAMDVNPVITPVLDLSRVAAGARGLDALMGVGPITPEVSSARANLLATTAEQANTDDEGGETPTTNLTFIQNNNSPKALSTNDIYRGSKSIVALAKEKLSETNRR